MHHDSIEEKWNQEMVETVALMDVTELKMFQNHKRYGPAVNEAYFKKVYETRSV